MRRSLAPILALMLACCFAACAFESDIPDSGPGDGSGGGDSGPEYPPPPYGTEYGDTAENFTVQRVSCQGDTGRGREWKLAEYLGAKAVLITVHAGWCTFCKQQASRMQAELEPYLGNGLEVMLLLTEDPSGSSQVQRLLDYACSYRQQYGFSFPIGIDPGGAATGQYFDGLPLNMLLDRDMFIRYRLPGELPDSNILIGNIEGLLDE